MSEQDRLDFLTALGESFCDELSPPVGWDDIVPQDAFEVFLRVFRREPDPALLSSLSDLELERLREGSERYFECESLTTDHLRKAVARTLARYPSGAT